MRILLVEDTRDVGEAISRRMGAIGHAIDWEVDGDVAAEILDYTDYDLVILDVNLPGLDGFQILKRFRSAKRSAPVLILTARSQIDDRIGALDLGADDYLVKPFDFRELEARARALLRRSAVAAEPVLTYGNVAFDRSSRGVRIGHREVHLLRREADILELFLSRPERVLRKDYLLQALSGDKVGANAIELYVSRIRKKIEGADVTIITHRGEGYELRCHASP